MSRLVVFAKRPRAGHVKTRLIPALGPERALAFHRAFVADQLRLLREFDRCRLELCVDGPWPADPEIDPLLEGIDLTEQGSGDLGQRLLRCVERAWSEGDRATVVLGADAPTLPTEHVRLALEHLDGGVPAVVSPATDGGYVLLGMGRPRAELFHSIPWGSAQVLEVTLARAREHAIDLRCIASWYDVDTPADVERLRHDLDQPGVRDRAPATARLLAGLPRPMV